MTENSNRLRHVLNMYYILNHSSSNPSVVYILIVTHPQNIFSFLCSNILRPRFALNNLDISYEDYRGRNHIFYFFFSLARKQFLDSIVSRVKHVLSHRLYNLQNIALRRIFHRIYNTITHPRLPLYASSLSFKNSRLRLSIKINPSTDANKRANVHRSYVQLLTPLLPLKSPVSLFKNCNLKLDIDRLWKSTVP